MLYIYTHEHIDTLGILNMMQITIRYRETDTHNTRADIGDMQSEHSTIASGFHVKLQPLKHPLE